LEALDRALDVLALEQAQAELGQDLGVLRLEFAPLLEQRAGAFGIPGARGDLRREWVEERALRRGRDRGLDRGERLLGLLLALQAQGEVRQGVGSLGIHLDGAA